MSHARATRNTLLVSSALAISMSRPRQRPNPHRLLDLAPPVVLGIAKHLSLRFDIMWRPLPLGALFLEMRWETVMIAIHEIPPFTHSVPIGVLVFYLIDALQPFTTQFALVP
jgi:hypothetical protein